MKENNLTAIVFDLPDKIDIIISSKEKSSQEISLSEKPSPADISNTHGLILIHNGQKSVVFGLVLRKNPSTTGPNSRSHFPRSIRSAIASSLRSMMDLSIISAPLVREYRFCANGYLFEAFHHGAQNNFGHPTNLRHPNSILYEGHPS